MQIPTHIISSELQASPTMQQLLAHERFKVVSSTKEGIEALRRSEKFDVHRNATIVPGSRRIALEIGVGAPKSVDASVIKRMLDECNRLLEEDLERGSHE